MLRVFCGMKHKLTVAHMNDYAEELKNTEKLIEVSLQNRGYFLDDWKELIRFESVPFDEADVQAMLNSSDNICYYSDLSFQTLESLKGKYSKGIFFVHVSNSGAVSDIKYLESLYSMVSDYLYLYVNDCSNSKLYISAILGD